MYIVLTALLQTCDSIKNGVVASATERPMSENNYMINIFIFIKLL